MDHLARLARHPLPRLARDPGDLGADPGRALARARVALVAEPAAAVARVGRVAVADATLHDLPPRPAQILARRHADVVLAVALRAVAPVVHGAVQVELVGWALRDPGV